MPVERYRPLLAKIEDQQSQLTALSANYELQVRQAYETAADDISERISDLIESRGGLENLTSRDRWRLTRDTGLLEQVEERIVDLGGQQKNLVTQAFTQAGTLAKGHLEDELADLVSHINVTSGVGTPVLGAVSFTQLDDAAIELGLGTALNDTQNLTNETRALLRREVTAGVAAGEGIRPLSRRIEGLAEVGANRAEMITRWATIKGYNLSHQVAYERSLSSIQGLKKMWLTQVDERTCPHCLAQHGTVVDVTEDFDPDVTYANKPVDPYQGFLQVPPLHPRCRCTITSWHESWRAYTESTPEELHADARDEALGQGLPKATEDVTGQGVLPTVGIQGRASSALGDVMSGIYVFDDFSGTVRLVDGADVAEARARLRNAGFRVRSVDGDEFLLKIDIPEGIPLPRMIRSTRLRALHADRWDMIKNGLLACSRD